MWCGVQGAKLISSITVTGIIGKRDVWRMRGIEFCWVDNLTFQIRASGSIHLRSSIIQVIYWEVGRNSLPLFSHRSALPGKKWFTFIYIDELLSAQRYGSIAFEIVKSSPIFNFLYRFNFNTYFVPRIMKTLY